MAWDDNRLEKKILGRKISRVRLNRKKEYLELTDAISGERMLFQAVGDCCNDVWIEHISGVDCLIDGTVQDIYESEWEDIPTHSYDVLDKMHYTIVTDRGHCQIELRNAHNGYYGGDLEYMEDLDHLQDPDDRREAMDMVELSGDLDCILGVDTLWER